MCPSTHTHEAHAFASTTCPTEFCRTGSKCALALLPSLNNATEATAHWQEDFRQNRPQIRQAHFSSSTFDERPLGGLRLGHARARDSLRLIVDLHSDRLRGLLDLPC